MQLFHDVRFPLNVAFGARGGPQRRTDVLTLASGAESRNTPHRHSRRLYDAGVGVKSLTDIHTLIAFFEARSGELHSFRFRDPLDHAATHQIIGVGDGTRTVFPLFKSYGDGAGHYERPIHNATLTDVAPDQSYSLENGEVVFAAPIPAGTPVTVSFTFDTIVRFATDRLDIALDSFGAGDVVSIPLIEVLPHELSGVGEAP